MTGNFWKTMFVKNKKTRRHDCDSDVKIIFMHSSILYLTLIFHSSVTIKHELCYSDTKYNLFILFYLFIFMYFTNLRLIRLISSSTNKRNARHITKRCKYAQYVIIDPINGSENVGNQVNERERRNWLTMHRYAE